MSTYTIDVGDSSTADNNWAKILYSSPTATRYFVFISGNNPASGGGTLDSLSAEIDYAIDNLDDSWPQSETVYIKFATFSKSGSTFTLVDSTSEITKVCTVSSGSVSFVSSNVSATGASLEVGVGNYIGIIIRVPSPSNSANSMWITAACDTYNAETDGFKSGWYYEGASSPTSFTGTTTVNVNVCINGLGSGSTSSSDPGNPSGSAVPADLCRTITDNYLIDEWYTGWGFFMFDRWNSTSSPLRVRLYVRAPWQTTGNTETIDCYHNTTYTWTNPSNANEKYSIKLNLTYFTGQPTLQYIDSIYECWWIDGEQPDTGNSTLYVSPNGGDGNTGLSWSAALRTLTKANSMIAVGGTINIQEGIFDNESHPEPYRSCTWDIYNRLQQNNVGCKVIISPDASVMKTVGKSNGGSSYCMSTSGRTVINHVTTVDQACDIWFFNWESYGQGSSGDYVVCKFKVFRPNGDNYDFVAESPEVWIAVGACDYVEYSNQYHFRYVPVGGNPLPVQVGDILGIWCNSSYYCPCLNGGWTSNESLKGLYQTGDITTNTAKSSWTKTSAYDPAIYAYGI